MTDDKEPPSLMRRGRNLAGAALRIGKAVMLGDTVFCRDFDAEQRLLICESCDMLDPDSRACMDCGCFVDAKAKLYTEHCPMSKWPGDLLL